MVLRRRFIFRGNAAAIGGRIVRPADTIVDSIAASSLTVAGGRSHGRSGATKFGQFVSIGAAATSTEGLFDNVQQQIALTNGLVAEETLTMTTRVHADVTTLIVGAPPPHPKLTIAHLHASMTGNSPAGSGEPPISIGNDTVIEGAAIDKFRLVITLATQVFQTNDTLSKLLTAADNPQFVKRSGALLFMTPTAAGAPAPRLVAASGVIYATIVRSIKWADKAFPGATIDQHVVTVPNLGKIFFGELLISDMSRRLTMVRLEIGSPFGGAIAGAEVETNGSWST